MHLVADFLIELNRLTEARLIRHKLSGPALPLQLIFSLLPATTTQTQSGFPNNSMMRNHAQKFKHSLSLCVYSHLQFSEHLFFRFTYGAYVWRFFAETHIAALFAVPQFQLDLRRFSTCHGSSLWYCC